jgi:hypothetical protein
MRAVAVAVAALALLPACNRPPPQNGYAVDVSVVPDATLPYDVLARIHKLDEHVAGAEYSQQQWVIGNQLISGGARYIYRPQIATGGLVDFTFTGFDDSGAHVARGVGQAKLVPGATVLLTVPLSALPVAVPPVDMCSPSSCGRGPDLATVDDLAGDAGAGPDLALSDNALCQFDCDTLSACGVHEGPGCTSACLLSPVFMACARTAGSDCNALALCYFKQTATKCPSGGYPTGSATCSATTTCQESCNASNPTPACYCPCATALDPSLALDNMIRSSCATAMCSSCVGNNFNGAACNACIAAQCASDPCSTH